jgi:hypothetical protein
LAQALYGRLTSADSIETYKHQVIWSFKQHEQATIKQTVERGMKKQLRFNKKQVDPWRLEYFATMYENSDKLSTDKLQTLLALSFLGFGLQRSRSAVVKTEVSFESEKSLCIEDVRLDRDLYAVWYGIKTSKGDPFAKRMGKDRKDWVPVAGCRDAAHPIDIVALLVKFCAKMGYRIGADGRLSSPQGPKTPFFQRIEAGGKPSGRPLTYNRLLQDMRDEQRALSTIYPECADSYFGLHSFRRFGATLAKTRGIPDDLIQLMGRWASLTFQRYFIFDASELVDINRQLLQG